MENGEGGRGEGGGGKNRDWRSQRHAENLIKLSVEMKGNINRGVTEETKRSLHACIKAFSSPIKRNLRFNTCPEIDRRPVLVGNSGQTLNEKRSKNMTDLIIAIIVVTAPENIPSFSTVIWLWFITFLIILHSIVSTSWLKQLSGTFCLGVLCNRSLWISQPFRYYIIPFW